MGLVVVIILLTGVVGVVVVDSITGQVARTRTIKGDISDRNGLPLYDDWRQSLSMVVATDESGRIVGWGPLESSKAYTLSLRSGWQLPLHINLGFYDPYRPARGGWVPCTVVYEVDSWMDIACDEFDSGLSKAYR